MNSQNKLNTQKTALNERESKALLKTYGVPVVTEVTAVEAHSAVKKAEEIGFPVVLKGFGSTLLHKTERGLVHLNLCNSEALRSAADHIVENAGEELEGFIIQPHLAGRREFVAGMFRDDLFGVVIMFGLGGIFTEAVRDVSFRLAPLDKSDAENMLAEINAQALLNDFRGERAVARSSLIDVLLGLSRLAEEREDISEIDINPLIVDPEGKIHAVDALVCLKQPDQSRAKRTPLDNKLVNRFFNPKSVAFIGASCKFEKWGFLLPLSTLSCNFKGKVYMVNPRGGTILGHEAYSSVSEIPAPIDLAVVTIPASGVLDLIPQLKDKGVTNMLIITSGFREVGESGENLEKELVRKASEAGILVIGPNTMGICNPHLSFSCLPFPIKPRAGSTALVCQSGNMGLQFLAFAEQQCIGIRSFCGSGNESMVSIPDYLNLFEDDPLIRIVMLYVESIQDGRYFFEAARRVSCKKPIVLLKGGQSKAGKKAASSHTGAIASDSRVFNAACRQAGIVRVEKSRTLLDVVAAFASQPVPAGSRVAIMTLGGGWGVITADLCSNLGLEIPVLSDELVDRVEKILPAFWSRANPIDIVATFGLEAPTIILEELLKWDGCDAVINLGILGKKFFFKRVISTTKEKGNLSAQENEDLVELSQKSEEQYIKDVVRLTETYKKPVIGVSLYDEEKDQTVYPVGGSLYKGLFYPTPERAVAVLAKMVQYGQFLQQQGLFENRNLAISDRN